MAKTRILVVDDDKEICDFLHETLSLAGYEMFSAHSGNQALIDAKDKRPDLIILDLVMPEIDGFQVKTKLNDDMLTSTIPVVMLTASDTMIDKLKGFEMGVNDYLTKPFHTEELLARVGSILSRKDFYEKISMTDGLTGLYNVYYFKRQFTLFFNIAKRYKKVFSLAMIDVNKLKLINDTLGHASGDFVLQELAAVLKECLRKADIITRYGGDEFAMIFPESDGSQTARAMERVKEKLAERIRALKKENKGVDFSVAVGIAAYRDSFDSEPQFFEAADMAMYEDKKLHSDAGSIPQGQ